MITLLPDRISAIFEAAGRVRVMVVGDLMIDRYLWGNVSRISPEAPVPIINIEDDEVRFGGAANVANNLIALGADPVLVGTVGDDNWGQVFRNQLSGLTLRADGLVTDPARPTTIKTRIIGNNQQIARVDREKTSAISPTVQNRIIELVAETASDVDAIILQDYNKGVMVPRVIREVIRIGRQHGKTITVDPKFDNFFEYQGATLFKPNRKETEEALARRLESETDIREAGAELLEKLQVEGALITLSERGMALFEKGHDPVFTRTRARKVADVSGAGDTVIAAVTFALAAGASMREAVTIANFAAGVVCQEVGVVPVDKERLLKTIANDVS